MVALAPTHLFTVKEYYQMADAGILAADARVELINGQIVDMFPVGPFHAGVGTQLQALLVPLCRGRWSVRVQYPIHLSEESEPQPDIALVRPRTDYYKIRHPQPSDVFLLIEVADSSVRFDREEKLPAYARAGITEYWLVDLVHKLVEIYRDPSPLGVYGSSSRIYPGSHIAPEVFPDARIAVSDLF